MTPIIMLPLLLLPLLLAVWVRLLGCFGLLPLLRRWAALCTRR